VVNRCWDTATVSERRTLVEALVDSDCIYPDQITVQVAEAPPFIVALDEVGLTQGCKPVMSGGRLAQSNGTRHRLLGEDVTEPLVGEHYHNLSEEL
jgi:hypothetical protein